MGLAATALSSPWAARPFEPSAPWVILWGEIYKEFAMPTGYTAPVQDGKITDFPAFAMQCARAFGALITMRDDSGPIPDELKPSIDYYDHSEAAARDELGMLDALTPEEAEKKRDAEFKEATKSFDKTMSERATHKKRYEAMLTKVQMWTPPTPDHQGLRDFMEQQLKESIKWDCTDYEQYRPRKKSVPVWLAERRGEAMRSLQHAQKDRADEIERTNNRNRWLKDLRESLKGI